MSEPVQASLWRLLAERTAAGDSCALATVLESQGSTPVKVGAKAILDSSGAILAGTVGGGVVEATAQTQAREAIQSGQPTLFEVRLQGGDALAPEPICGGWMRVLIDPTVSQHRAAYIEAYRALTERRRGVVMTCIKRPSMSPATEIPARSLSTEWMDECSLHSREHDTRTEAIQAAMRGTTSLFVLLESEAVLIEPVLPQPLLVIVGGGHVGQAVARQAAWVGFQVKVIEDREEFAQPTLFPENTLTVCGTVRRELERLDAGADTYVVLVSRGHLHDAEALEVCIHKPWAYLGMIGSKRKVALLRQEFIRTGRATATAFDRVYAPIGLDLGAVTVPEIAASIVAQLISVRRRGTASRMPTGTPGEEAL